MKTTGIAVLCLVALLYAPSAAVAKDDPLAPARAAYAAYEAQKEASRDKRETASKATRDAKTDEERQAARDAFMKVLRETGVEEEAALDRFLGEFDKTDTDAWSVENDAALLETGLYEGAMDAMKHDPKRALARFEMLLQKLPKCGSAPYVRHTWMAIALPSAGDLEHAKKRLTQLVAEVEEPYVPQVRMGLGDIEALMGDYEAAQKEYAAALALIPADAHPRNDPRGRARSYLSMRADLVGKPAPELEASIWLGSGMRSLGSMKGSVVILDFWATWCGPCINGMPGMDDLYKEFREQKLEVIGATRYYDHGYMPSGMEELRKGERHGHAVRELDGAAYVRHVQEFRDKTGVSYPFAICSPNDFKRYNITGIPTMFVIDKQGKIAFVAVGGAKEHLLKQAVQRLLKA